MFTKEKRAIVKDAAVRCIIGVDQAQELPPRGCPEAGRAAFTVAVRAAALGWVGGGGGGMAMTNENPRPDK